MSPDTQQVSGRVVLTNGPSTDRICDSYKYAYDKSNKVAASFVDPEGREFRIRINELAHADGTGNYHLFAGNVVSADMDEISLGFTPRFAAGRFDAGSPRLGYIFLSEDPLPLGGPAGR